MSKHLVLIAYVCKGNILEYKISLAQSSPDQIAINSVENTF